MRRDKAGAVALGVGSSLLKADILKAMAHPVRLIAVEALRQGERTAAERLGAS